jgi:hypothetical protein
MKLNIVRASAGRNWVKLGMRTFFRKPLALGGLFFMFLALMSLVSKVPVVGLVLAMVFLPGATLGLMAAAREADAGRFPMPVTLITAFRNDARKRRDMLVLGALYALGFMSALGGSWLVDGGGFARVYLGGDMPAGEQMMESGFQGAMWAFIALHLPVSLMFWHAPALVHWHGLPPLKSLFFSAVACLRNLRAFLVFGLSWLAVLLALLVVVTTLLSLAGLGQVAGDVLFPLLMLMAAMFFSSLYFTFRDCFDFTTETSHEPAPPAGPNL